MDRTEETEERGDIRRHFPAVSRENRQNDAVAEALRLLDLTNQLKLSEEEAKECGDVVGPKHEQILRTLCSNVNDPPPEPHSEKSKEVMSTIVELQADVVCLQELRAQ